MRAQKMNIIYPADYFNPNRVDEMFETEANAFKEAGFNVYSWNNKAVPAGEYIYRGWMLLEDEYDNLVSFLAKNNGTLMTSKEQYLSAHYLPNWYEKLKELTPETIITTTDNIELAMKSSKWDNFFVKDYVKSLTTTEGSIASSPADVLHKLKELENRKGIIGGVCLRKVHDFDNESEIRYFCFKDKIITPNDHISDIVKEVQKRIDLPFYSIDVIKDTQGKEWVVEIGDGQVSDLKYPWDAEDFATSIKNINKKTLKFKP